MFTMCHGVTKLNIAYEFRTKQDTLKSIIAWSTETFVTYFGYTVFGLQVLGYAFL